MDYTDILKRAWNVTWKYKALWWLGFFAGSGISSGNSGSRTTGGSTPFSGAAFQSFMERYGAIIVVAGLFAVVIGIVIGVIALAARGGLIHLVNEAEEGRPVRLRDGWRAGFAKWWRLFGVSFLAGLPVLIIVGIIVAIVGASAFSAFAAYTASGGGTPSDALVRSLVAPLLGAWCFVIVLLIVAAFFGVVLGVAASLGLRYVMLEDRRALDALKQGWSDVWGKRGAVLMFWVLTAVGIGVGLVFGFVGAMFALPAVALSGGAARTVGGGLAGLLGLILLVPAAIYGTFIDASWTIFFRRMTGLEAAPVAVAAPVYGAPAGYVPPAPTDYAAAPVYAPPAPAVMTAPEPAQFEPAPMPAPEPPASPEPPAPESFPPPPADA